MWGAIIGDIAGSRFEGSRGGPKDFELFHRHCTYTDDTVCTAAVAHIVVNDRKPDSTLQQWCRRHPGRGYGGAFRKWIASDVPAPYGSFGNGAAMRVSPVALLYRGASLEEALAVSDRVTKITHDHPEGIKGARAVTEAIWLAGRGEGTEVLRREITKRYGYDLERSLEDIRPSHRFDVTCQGTVPTALVCTLESTSLEDAVRSAVSLGGDADTLAAIAGAIGEALHGLPEQLLQTVRERYLRDADDITGALDVLYGRTKCEATPATATDIPDDVVSGAQARVSGKIAGGVLNARGEGAKDKTSPVPVPDIPDDVVNRAQGCLLGQIAGDSLGSLVEFEDASTIRALYPDGVRELADGGVWNTLAGQPTDDSEMALALARSIVRNEGFSIEDIHTSYVRWKESRPFDIGRATECGLNGNPILDSQANGALMRISPLGIFGWRMEPEALAKLAAEDAALTHSHRICQQVSGLYASAIAEAIREGLAPTTVYDRMVARAVQWNFDQAVRECIEHARTHRPPEFSRKMGWVLIAFQNALYQLLHAPTLEAGVIGTVHCGGDTDTNGAICGALLGAVYGRDVVPEQWVDRIAMCRPTDETTQPRPKEFWPNDALRLGETLLQAGASIPSSFSVPPGQIR